MTSQVSHKHLVHFTFIMRLWRTIYGVCVAGGEWCVHCQQLDEFNDWWRNLLSGFGFLYISINKTRPVIHKFLDSQRDSTALTQSCYHIQSGNLWNGEDIPVVLKWFIWSQYFRAKILGIFICSFNNISKLSLFFFQMAFLRRWGGDHVEHGSNNFSLFPLYTLSALLGVRAHDYFS